MPLLMKNISKETTLSKKSSADLELPFKSRSLATTLQYSVISTLQKPDLEERQPPT